MSDFYFTDTAPTEIYPFPTRRSSDLASLFPPLATVRITIYKEVTMKRVQIGALLILIQILYCRQVIPKISLTLDRAPVAEVLQAMAAQQQRNIALAPAIDGTVTRYLHDVPWQQPFTMI